MDPGSPSPFSKLANSNARGSDAGQFEEVPLSILSLGQWEPGRDAELEKQWASQKELESVLDAIPTAVTQTNHKVAAEKSRFHTLGYQKRQKNNVITDFGTVSKGVSGSSRSRGGIQALFAQGLSEKAPNLEERSQLESLKQALQSFPLPALPDWKRGGGGGGGGGGGEGGEGEGGVTDVSLEESWTRIVHSHVSMSKTQRHQQEALWELIHTELNYIRKLTIVNDLVIAALVYLRNDGFLSEVTPELLFSNLPSILQAHRLFWHEVLLPSVQEVRETGKPFDPVKLEEGCMQFSERFAPYLQYCWEEERIMDFTRKQASNPHFQAYVEWVETCPLVHRMRLGDMQAKPHMRITKYRLVLEAILKSTQDPVAQYSVRRMLTSVNSFVDSINAYLAFKCDELALSQSAQRVEGYEVTETTSEEIDKHIKEFCSFDLTSPILGLGPGDTRKLVSEETLRIREKKDNKVEVVVLLFSDVLLVTKVQRKSEKLKVVRPPLGLERTRCAALKDGCSFVLVEKSELGCAVNVYTIFTPTPESCYAWVNAIATAQKSLATKREREMSHRLGDISLGSMQVEKQVLPLSEAERIIEEQKEQIRQLKVELALLSGQKQENGGSEKPSENGTLPFTITDKNLQNQLKNLNSPLAGRNIPSSQSARGNFAMGRGKRQNRNSGKMDVAMSKGQAEEDRELTEDEYPGIKERRVTWNSNKPRPGPASPKKHIISPAVSNENQSNASQSPLPGKRQTPEITHTKSAPSLNIRVEEFNLDTLAWDSISKEGPPQGGKSSWIDSEGQSSDQQSGRDSNSSQSEDDFLKEPRAFSRRQNSPRLRRGRPVVQHGPFPQPPNSEDAVFVFSASSSAASDYKRGLQWTPQWPAQKSHSHLGLGLSAGRGNWAGHRNGAVPTQYPEPGTISEPELPAAMPEQNSQKRPKFKTQRSVSIPDIIIQAGSLETDSQTSQCSQPEGGIQRHSSLAPGILERVRGRAEGRGREGAKARRSSTSLGTRSFFLDSAPSASRSASPSPSRCEAGLHTPTAVQEGEEEEGGKKGGKHSYSFPFPPVGASVDWSGWCVDDDEVMVFLVPEDSGDQGVAGDSGGQGVAGDSGGQGVAGDSGGQGVAGDSGGQGVAGDRGSRTLTLSDLQRISRQEDGECSEV